MQTIIHTGDKSYMCQMCNKLFRRKIDLDKHMLIHTGKKPHPCYVYKKSFTLKGDLNKHMLIHIEERPHVCESIMCFVCSSLSIEDEFETIANATAVVCFVCSNFWKCFVRSSPVENL
ncbi:zinc finger protein 11-like, partial [Stegodyphus dumicola]|uniref:zinc finger protein 11-like n=1 Tax=Stegodyphus dumicola TaxID=202533 RepID=UPI0015A7CDA2